MANKTLGTRQKLVFRAQPAHSVKPRNPVAVAAKARNAGVHGKTVSAKRQLQRRALKKLLDEE